MILCYSAPSTLWRYTHHRELQSCLFPLSTASPRATCSSSLSLFSHLQQKIKIFLRRWPSRHQHDADRALSRRPAGPGSWDVAQDSPPRLELLNLCPSLASSTRVLLTHLAKQQVVAQVLGFLPPTQSTCKSSWLPDSACHSSGCWGP